MNNKAEPSQDGPPIDADPKCLLAALRAELAWADAAWPRWPGRDTHAIRWKLTYGDVRRLLVAIDLGTFTAPQEPD